MNRALYRTLLMVFFLLSVGSLISGCNTIEGVGEDMQEAGAAL